MNRRVHPDGLIPVKQTLLCVHVHRVIASTQGAIKVTSYIQPKELEATNQLFCIVGIEFITNPRYSNRPEIQYKIITKADNGFYEERFVTFFARQSDNVTPHAHNMQEAYLFKNQLPSHNCILTQDKRSKNYSFVSTSFDPDCPCKALQKLMTSVEYELQTAITLDNSTSPRYTIESLRKQLKLQQHVIAVFADVKIGRVSEACRGLPCYKEDLEKILQFLNKKLEETGYKAITESQMDWNIKNEQPVKYQ